MNYQRVTILFLLLGAICLLEGFEFRHPDALYDEPDWSPLERGRMHEQEHEYDRAGQHYLQIDDIIVREMTLNQLSTAWDSVNAGILRAQEAVKQQPHLATARLSLAQQYYSKGLLCRQYIESASGIYPRDFVFEEQEYFFSESLRQAQKALQLESNLPKAHLLIGEIYLANNRLEDALSELKRLIGKDPDYAKGYYALGKVYLDMKHYDKVERYLIRTIKLDPDFVDAYYLLGQFYFERQWYDYAAYTFLEVLRKNPADKSSFDLLIDSCHELGKYYVDQEEYDKAIYLFQEVLRVKSSYPVYQSSQLAKNKKAEAALKAEEAAMQEEVPPEEAGAIEPSLEPPEPEAISLPSPEQAVEVAPEVAETPPAEVAETPPESVPVTQLRNTPATLSNRDIVQMVQERGFNHPNNLTIWGLSETFRGNFQHHYKVQSANGEDLVVDQATGLMWQQSGSSEKVNWAEAKTHIQQLNQSGYAGYTDWRLPTVEELASLLEFEQINGNAYVDSVFDATLDFCWSADTVADSDAAWAVAFHSGHVYFDPLDRMNYVRAVR